MATVGVGGQLNFINRQKSHVLVDGHALDRANIITRVGRDDFFFARNERDVFFAFGANDLVVIFARQQAQRKADHARGVTHHTIHSQERLAGIGRPENGRDSRSRRRG